MDAIFTRLFLRHNVKEQMSSQTSSIPRIDRVAWMTNRSHRPSHRPSISFDNLLGYFHPDIEQTTDQGKMTFNFPAQKQAFACESVQSKTIFNRIGSTVAAFPLTKSEDIENRGEKGKPRASSPSLCIVS